MKNDYRAFMMGAITFVLVTLVYGLAALGYDTSYSGDRYWGLTHALSYPISGEPTFLKYLGSGIVIAFFILIRVLAALIAGFIAALICYGIVWLFTRTSPDPVSAIPSVPPAPQTQSSPTS